MIELLQSKLDTLNYNLNNDIIHEEGYSFMLGQQELLMELLNSHYSMLHQEECYDDHDYYGNDYHCEQDDWFDHLYILEHYKQEEINNMYNTYYYHSSFLGKNIMSSDNCWFTSDEIEAFRIIWQRRISAM